MPYKAIASKMEAAMIIPCLQKDAAQSAGKPTKMLWGTSVNVNHALEETVDQSRPKIDTQRLGIPLQLDVA